MSCFGKNIKKIRGIKRLSQQSFAEIFGLKRATLGAYEEERSEPKIDTIIQVANHFSIPIDDLLTKELTVNELLRFKGEITVDIKDKDYTQFAEIPLITSANRKDFIQYYDKKKFIADMPQIVLPVDTSKSWLAYTVTNLEMTTYEEGLFPGDIVIGEGVSFSDLSEIKDQTMVLILVEHGLMLRRLYTKNAKIILAADHPSVEDVQLDKTEVLACWEICSVFYNRVPGKPNSWRQRVLRLEEKISKLP